MGSTPDQICAYQTLRRLNDYRDDVESILADLFTVCPGKIIMEYSCDDKRLVFGLQKFSSYMHSCTSRVAVCLFRINETKTYNGDIRVDLYWLRKKVIITPGIESWNILFWHTLPDMIDVHEPIMREWISNINKIKNAIYKDSTEDIPITCDCAYIPVRGIYSA
jgi:hypothetical protein